MDEYLKRATDGMDAEQLANWVKAAQPGAECAPLCANCLKEWIYTAKWVVGGVVVKYGIKFADGYRNPIGD